MSLRDLVDGECGGANQLMRMGGQLTRDNARKDEGFSGTSVHPGPRPGPSEEFVNEFLTQAGRAAPAPQSFRMDSLLKEMQGIQGMQQQPPGAHAQTFEMWRNDFVNQQRDLFDGPSGSQAPGGSQLLMNRPGPSVDTMNWTREFFNEGQTPSTSSDIPLAAQAVQQHFPGHPGSFQYSEFANFVNNVADQQVTIDQGQVQEKSWATEFNNPDSWLEDFQQHATKQTEDNEKYNQEFWNRLQEEWKKISDENDEGHPWLSDFTNYYDPYKEYTFDENTPTENIENAFEKGKQFLAQGDIPSAVYCFESAVKQHPENAEFWEYLGTSQAENEKDPNAIAALKKSLELQPNNGKVMMALAVSFTNESLQNQALKMLLSWLKSHPVYGPLVPMSTDGQVEQGAEVPSSLIRGPELLEVQGLLLNAVQASSPNVDAELQEALGVLFNLSSEYDKAVDCFRAAAMAQPGNAKTWNRLGASLANGNRSTEAVDAYQRALEIHPGFIRARYNVGIICINLKAYREAVEHFLTALNHQASSRNRSGINIDLASNQMSDTIWSTLRMAISLMGRHDLQPAIDNRDLSTLNQAFEVPSTASGSS